MSELPEHQPHHGEIAAEELPGPFLSSLDVQAIVGVYALRVQEVEDYWRDMLIAYDITQNPTGLALQHLGASVEFTWDDTQITDVEARTLLDAWLTSNGSRGTLDDMWAVWDSLGETSNVTAHRLPQGTLWTWNHDAVGYYEQRVLEILHRASSAGLDDTYLAIVDISTAMTFDHVGDISAGNTTPGLGPDWIHGHGLSNATTAETLQSHE